MKNTTGLSTTFTMTKGSARKDCFRRGKRSEKKVQVSVG